MAVLILATLVEILFRWPPIRLNPMVIGAWDSHLSNCTRSTVASSVGNRIAMQGLHSFYGMNIMVARVFGTCAILMAARRNAVAPCSLRNHSR